MLEKLLELNGLESDKKPTEEDYQKKIKELEAQNEMLTECILEIANIIYA